MTSQKQTTTPPQLPDEESIAIYKRSATQEQTTAPPHEKREGIHILMQELTNNTLHMVLAIDENRLFRDVVATEVQKIMQRTRRK